uniref:Protein Smaug n=1 Tax=Cuerna arida TaxID=1464854 RepID=A0A1B6EQB0_9HEMI
MKMYQERVDTMCQWFDQWDISGQMVALFKMVTRVKPTQARFLSIALENCLTECAEVALREQEANNPGYISNLLNEPKERAMDELLLHLPLLRPGNKEAKHMYLGVLPVVLNHALDNNLYLEKATQLLVYILIHPALKEDRCTFDVWRKSLEDRIMNLGVNPAVTNTESTDTAQGKIRRSNSLTPPFAVTPSNELWTSQDDLSVVRRSSGRRFSLSLSEGPPLSPQSSQASSGSGSETHLDDLRPGFEAVGMKDVRPWLKTLRLHKYSRLFSQLTYAQMLNLKEETFEATVESVEAGPVTQGAQRKILLSIAKLRDRYANLCRLEQEITEGSGKNLLSAMDDVKNILLTPLKPHEDTDQPPVDDLPSQITRVLYKVCTLLLVCGVMDDEALTTFVNLLDTALYLDAFTTQQKNKIRSWKLQISQHISQIRQQQQQYGYLSVPPARFPQPVSRPLSAHPLRHSPLRSHPHHHTQSFLAKRPSLQDSPSEVSFWPADCQYGSAEEPGHSYVQRTHSAPPNPPPEAPSDTDPELNSRLERLCLRMTEQSLEL